jgi:D-alanyl-D-alanine carboxypeptidase
MVIRLAVGAFFASGCSAATAPTTTSASRTPATSGGPTFRFSKTLAQQNLDLLASHGEATGALFGISIRGGPPILLSSGVWDHATNRRVEPSDAFYVASITKTFVGALMLKLVDQHLVRLDDPINRYGMPFGPNGDTITVRDLLAHTSGIVPFSGPADQADQAVERPLAYSPGTRTTYSNVDTQLAGEIIEHVTGKALVAVLHRELLDPLHLASTRYAAAEPAPANTIPMAVPDSAAQAASEGAAGGIVSDLADLINWGNAFLRTGSILTPSSRALAVAISPGGTGLGTLGWADQQGFCVLSPTGCPGGARFRALGGSGGAPGVSSILVYNKDNDTIIAAFANSQGVPLAKLAPLAWTSQRLDP